MDRRREVVGTRPTAGTEVVLETLVRRGPRVLLGRTDGASGPAEVGAEVKIWLLPEDKRRRFLGRGRLLAWLYPARPGSERCEISGDILPEFANTPPLPIVQVTKPRTGTAHPLVPVVPDCPGCGGRLVRVSATGMFRCFAIGAELCRTCRGVTIVGPEPQSRCETCGGTGYAEPRCKLLFVRSREIAENSEALLERGVGSLTRLAKAGNAADDNFEF